MNNKHFNLFPLLTSKNKKGNTKTELIFIFLSFYAILTVLMGFIGNTINTNLQEQNKSFDNQSSFFKGIFLNVITGYGVLPYWINLIIFIVPSTVLLWIIISSLPTLNGGG